MKQGIKIDSDSSENIREIVKEFSDKDPEQIEVITDEQRYWIQKRRKKVGRFSYNFWGGLSKSSHFYCLNSEPTS